VALRKRKTNEDEAVTKTTAGRCESVRNRPNKNAIGERHDENPQERRKEKNDTEGERCSS